MGPEALAAFLHEYRVRFPVGVDAPGEAADPLPQTMRAYGLRGTPSTVLFDATGAIRAELFGVHDDLALGAAIGALLAEAGGSLTIRPAWAREERPRCEDGCGPGSPGA
jgi:hypothetical protein